jgi:hypothetical protein
VAVEGRGLVASDAKASQVLHRLAIFAAGPRACGGGNLDPHDRHASGRGAAHEAPHARPGGSAVRTCVAHAITQAQAEPDGLIVILVFVPPAVACIAAIPGSVIVSITVTVVLCYVLPPPMKRMDRGDGRMMRKPKADDERKRVPAGAHGCQGLLRDGQEMINRAGIATPITLLATTGRQALGSLARGPSGGQRSDPADGDAEPVAEGGEPRLSLSDDACGARHAEGATAPAVLLAAGRQTGLAASPAAPDMPRGQADVVATAAMRGRFTPLEAT